MAKAVIRESELAPGEVMPVRLEGWPPIALYNLNGEFFATYDTCTHGAAMLSEGDIEDGDIICPFHDGSFNIRTGEASGAPCTIAINTYEVEIVDGMVCIASPGDAAR